jgi:hypothetical protein
MSIHRQVEKRNIEDIIKENKDNHMCHLKVESDEASI